MKLFYCDDMLGVISDVSGSDLWMNGSIHLSKKGKELRFFFEWMVEEEHMGEEPLFSPDLLNSENWHLQEDDGKKLSIDIPAVHINRNEISWRWR